MHALSIILALAAAQQMRVEWHNRGQGACLGYFRSYEKRAPCTLEECKAYCIASRVTNGTSAFGCRSFYTQAGGCDLNVDRWTEIDVDLGLFFDRQTPSDPKDHPVVGINTALGGECWEYEMVTLTETGTATVSATASTTRTESRTATVSESIDLSPTSSQTMAVPRSSVTITAAPLQKTTATLTENHPPEDPTPSQTIPRATYTMTHRAPPPKPLLPEDITAQQKEVSSAVGVGLMVSGLLSGSAGSTPTLGKMALLMQLDCNSYIEGGDQGDPLPWELHPVGDPIGSHRGSYEVGALVYNTVIVLGFAAVMGAVAWVVYKVKGLEGYVQGLGVVRCPGLVYIPVLFLMQGVAFAAPKILVRPEKLPFHVVMLAGGFVVILVLGPLILYLNILRARCFHAYYQPDPEVINATGWVGKLKRVVLGSNVWFSGERNPDFVKLYGVIFDSNRDGVQAWCVFDCYHVLFVGGSTALKPEDTTTCHARNFSLVAAMFLYFIAIVYYRPFSSRFDNFASGVISFLILIAVLLMTIGILSPSDATFRAAAYFFVVSTYVLLLKTAYDIVAYTLTFACGTPKQLEAVEYPVDFDAEVIDLSQRGGDYSHPLLNKEARTPTPDTTIEDTTSDGSSPTPNRRRIHTLSVPNSSFRLRAPTSTLGSPTMLHNSNTHGSFILQAPGCIIQGGSPTSASASATYAEL